MRMTVMAYIEKATVLIETYWNVNTVLTFLSFRCQMVLIETYWNVNGEKVLQT